MNPTALSLPIWSAAPTPLHNDGSLDRESVERLMEHQIANGVTGVFIGGTSGEGPWLPRRVLRELADATVKAAAGRIPVALQITDNSADRMIELLDELAGLRFDYAVIAPPFFQSDASQSFLAKLYERVIEYAPCPVGLYHRGPYSSVKVEAATLAEIAAHPKVKLLKDSSGSAADRDCFFAARERRPAGELPVFIVDEFNCAAAATAGYDGMLLGGACFNAPFARRILTLAAAGKREEAQVEQEKLNQLMFQVFGGGDLHAWLGGQKEILVQLRVFSTSQLLLNYPLDDATRQAIRRIVAEHRAELLPEFR